MQTLQTILKHVGTVWSIIFDTLETSSNTVERVHALSDIVQRFSLTRFDVKIKLHVLSRRADPDPTMLSVAENVLANPFVSV